jgi:hypothetical protein
MKSAPKWYRECGFPDELTDLDAITRDIEIMRSDLLALNRLRTGIVNRLVTRWRKRNQTRRNVSHVTNHAEVQ